MKFLEKILGDPNKKILKVLEKEVEKINVLEEQFSKLSRDDLRRKTEKFRQQLKDGAKLDDLLVEAFAVMREAAKRTLGQRAFDVQLEGGIALHQGKITEMKTGEGKTLAATAPVYLNALTGKGVHIVTVNDYLARRDTSWMGKIYDYLGVSAACLQHEKSFIFNREKAKEFLSDDDSQAKTEGVVLDVEDLAPVTRKEAYQADITYGTNNEFGFDYLRDNMVQDLSQCVQRELNFAIIDEADSILIDEARTPLIISAPTQGSTDMYCRFAQIAKSLEENKHYNIDEKDKAATLTDSGIREVEKILGIKNIYEEGGVTTVHHLEEALKSEALFKKDRDYVIREGEVVIVDQFTGRLMPGRRYSEGLHQAIEAKEGVEVRRESLTLATISLQNYFRLYKKLAGMTGTAATEAEEFYKIYGTDVVVIPTNKPMIRVDRSDKVYKTRKARYEAVVRDVKEHQEKGQPVLVGTVSIENNEELSAMFKKAGIRYEVLNAKNNEKEAKIIAQAGREGAVTLATNIAGRGVDIILGGNPPDEKAKQKVIGEDGLYVIGTERHEARRIDNQLRGRGGRQGDPGISQFYVSLEDDLMRIFGGDRIKGLMDTLRLPEDQPIENAIISRSIESAQKRVEGHNFDIRKHLVEYDDVLNRHRDTIYRKRKEILSSKDLKDEITKLFEQEIAQLVGFHTQGTQDVWNLNELCENLHALTGEVIEKAELENLGEQENIQKFLIDKLKTKYEEKEKEWTPEVTRKLEKAIYLRAIDSLWIEHLTAIENLRAGIGLRGYAQKDPLVEYKAEAFRMFKQLLDSIREQVLHLILKVQVSKEQIKSQSRPEQQNLEMKGPQKEFSTLKKGVETQEAMKREVQKTQVSTASKKKVGRNDPCPCGAKHSDGRPVKYKKCCYPKFG